MFNILRRLFVWASVVIILATVAGRSKLSPALKLQLLIAQLIVAAFSSVVANDLVGYVCRGTAPTALTTPIKMSLHTADPGTTGASEVVGGSYARQSGANPMYAAASGGACALAATVSFASMPAVTVTHIGLWDSNGTPKFLQGAALSASQAVGAGNTLQITSATNTFTGT